MKTGGDVPKIAPSGAFSRLAIASRTSPGHPTHHDFRQAFRAGAHQRRPLQGPQNPARQSLLLAQRHAPWPALQNRAPAQRKRRRLPRTLQGLYRTLRSPRRRRDRHHRGMVAAYTASSIVTRPASTSSTPATAPSAISPPCAASSPSNQPNQTNPTGPLFATKPSIRNPPKTHRIPKFRPQNPRARVQNGAGDFEEPEGPGP